MVDEERERERERERDADTSSETVTHDICKPRSLVQVVEKPVIFLRQAFVYVGQIVRQLHGVCVCV